MSSHQQVMHRGVAPLPRDAVMVSAIASSCSLVSAVSLLP